MVTQTTHTVYKLNPQTMVSGTQARRTDRRHWRKSIDFSGKSSFRLLPSYVAGVGSRNHDCEKRKEREISVRISAGHGNKWIPVISRYWIGFDPRHENKVDRKTTTERDQVQVIFIFHGFKYKVGNTPILESIPSSHICHIFGSDDRLWLPFSLWACLRRLARSCAGLHCAACAKTPQNGPLWHNEFSWSTCTQTRA